MIGPGKYDDLATWVMEKTNCKAVVLMVIGGDHGDGCSLQQRGELLLPGYSLVMPQLLRDLASGIEQDMKHIREAARQNPAAWTCMKCGKRVSPIDMALDENAVLIHVGCES